MKRKMSMSYFSNLRNHREFTSRKNYENIFGYRVYSKNEATGMKFICEANKFIQTKTESSIKRFNFMPFIIVKTKAKTILFDI